MNFIDRILTLFDEHLPNVKLFYSVKANDDPLVLRHLQMRGVGFDVASVNEMVTVMTNGAHPENLILSNTVKSPACIREIFYRRIAATTVDNESALNAIALESTFHAFRPRIFARVKVPALGVHINLNEKFGCSVEDAIDLLERAHEVDLTPAGVHFHVGTQCSNPLSYRAGIQSAMEVISTVNDEIGTAIDTINIGGGFPDVLVAAEYGGLEKFFTDLGEIVRGAQDEGYNIVAEPGRVIAAGAGIAVSQVIGRNIHEGKHWIYLDDGIYGLYSTAHYEKRKFDLIPLSGPREEMISCVVAGPTCDSLDVIGDGMLLPSAIKTGDYVMAEHAGAYSISVKSHFNGMGQITSTVSQHALVETDHRWSKLAVNGV